MSSNLSDVEWIVEKFGQEAERRRSSQLGSDIEVFAWQAAWAYLDGLAVGLEQATRVANARCKPDPRQQCGVAGCEGKSEYIHNLQFLYVELPVLELPINLCDEHMEEVRNVMGKGATA